MNKIVWIMMLLLFWAIRSASGASLERYDFAYRISGETEARPTQVFDDGRKLYLQFANTSILPTVYADGGQGDVRVDAHQDYPYVVLDHLFNTLQIRVNGHAASIHYAGAKVHHPGSTTYGQAAPDDADKTMRVAVAVPDARANTVKTVAEAAVTVHTPDNAGSLANSAGQSRAHTLVEPSAPAPAGDVPSVQMAALSHLNTKTDAAETPDQSRNINLLAKGGPETVNQPAILQLTIQTGDSIRFRLSDFAKQNGYLLNWAGNDLVARQTAVFSGTSAEAVFNHVLMAAKVVGYLSQDEEKVLNVYVKP